MAGRSADQPSFADSINRSLNLLVTSLLGITGLTFGTHILLEPDLVDKVDNTLLVTIGVIAVVWYFLGRNWAMRSRLPVALAAAAVVAQILGFAIEIGDLRALGDDLLGILVVGPTFILAVILYSRNGRYLQTGPSSSG